MKQPKNMAQEKWDSMYNNGTPARIPGNCKRRYVLAQIDNSLHSPSEHLAAVTKKPRRGDKFCLKSSPKPGAYKVLRVRKTHVLVQRRSGDDIEHYRIPRRDWRRLAGQFEFAIPRASTMCCNRAHTEGMFPMMPMLNCALANESQAEHHLAQNHWTSRYNGAQGWIPELQPTPTWSQCNHLQRILGGKELSLESVPVVESGHATP